MTLKGLCPITLAARALKPCLEGFEAFRVFPFGLREQDRRDGIGVGFELALLFWGHLSQEVAMGASLTAHPQY